MHAQEPRAVPFDRACCGAIPGRPVAAGVRARAAGMLVLVLFACAPEPDAHLDVSRRGAARGFDLLLITLDTTRADRLGCYGYLDAGTPRIDELSRGGVRFDAAFAPAPLTLPSHSTLMTGIDPPDHGVRNNGVFRLGAEHVTLAESLAERGYRTGAVIGAFVLDARFGLDQGFDHYDDTSSEARVGRAYRAERPAADVTDAALAWLDETALADDRRFFLWVHYFDPHAPYASPGAEVGDAYQSEIAYVDGELGRLIDRLEEAGRLERTLVVLTADHGEGLWEHGEKTHGLLVHDAALRVPLLLSNPRLFPEARVVDDRVTGLLDVLPMLSHLLDLAPGPSAGRNPLVGPADPQRVLYFETLRPLLDRGWAPLVGVRRLRDKFVDGPAAEYYDVGSDPDELENLLESVPAGLPTLRARLEELRQGWPPEESVLGTQQEVAPEVAARLAALGYTRSDTPIASGRERPDPKQMLAVDTAVWDAKALALEGRHDEAIQKIEAALAASPGDGEGWYAAYAIYLAAGHVEEAIAAMRRGVVLKPHPDGWAALARALYQVRRLDEADAALEAGARLDPEDGSVLVTRALGLWMRGERDAAMDAIERTMALDPRYAESARALRRYIEGGRPPDS